MSIVIKQVVVVAVAVAVAAAAVVAVVNSFNISLNLLPVLFAIFKRPLQHTYSHQLVVTLYYHVPQ